MMSLWWRVAVVLPLPGALAAAAAPGWEALQVSDSAVGVAADNVRGFFLNDVTWTGGMFVAVGDYGLVLTSPDGIDWSSSRIPGDPHLEGVTGAGSRLMAVGGRFAFRSSDGITWEATEVISAGQMQSQAQGEGDFTPQWELPQLGLLDVAWSGERFVAVGRKRAADDYTSEAWMFHSVDGRHWNRIDREFGVELESIAWTGSSFVAAGPTSHDYFEYTTSIVFTSQDGLSWQQAAAPPGWWAVYGYVKDVAPSGGGFATVGFRNLRHLGDESFLHSYPDGVSAEQAYVTPRGSFYHGVAAWQEKFVVVGWAGQERIIDLLSLSGGEWSLESRWREPGLRLNKVAASPDRLVAVGEGETILTSTDGVSWDRVRASEKEIWRFETGTPFTSPAIGGDGTLYAGTRYTDQGLLAFNPDGSLRWRSPHDWITSEPAVGGDGTIYIGSRNGNYGLSAVNPDGTQRWRFQTTDEVRAVAIGLGGTLFVGTFGEELLAVNPDGTEQWRLSLGEGYWSNPSLSIGRDGTLYTVARDDRLYAIRPDGGERWRIWRDGGFAPPAAIGADGAIYIGSQDEGHLYVFNPDGTERWRFKTGWASHSPVIAADGAIYISAYDGSVAPWPQHILYAINSDGTMRWRFISRREITSTPALGADGTIYLTSYTSLYAIDRDGTLQWKSPTGYFVESSPTIGHDGTVYFGSNGGFHAVAGDTPLADSPWPKFRHDLRNTGASGANEWPQIVRHPETQIVVPGTSALLTVVGGGAPPLSYQWQKDGEAIAGETNASLTLENFQIADEGFYSVTVSNAYGAVTSLSVRVTVTVPLAEALDAPLGFSWSSGGATSWFGQKIVSRDGVSAARSGAIGEGQESWLETTITGPGSLSFWWKVSSRNHSGFLEFFINGERRERLSGEVDWSMKSYLLPAGDHTVRWTYRKEGALSSGQDTAWVDQLVFVAENSGRIAVTDSVAPDDDHHLPFGVVEAGQQRQETITIRNTSLDHGLVVERIYLRIAGEKGETAGPMKSFTAEVEDEEVQASSRVAGGHGGRKETPPRPDWSRPHDPETILVKFQEDAGHSQRMSAHARSGGRVAHRMRRLPLEVVKIPPNTGLAEVLERYRANPFVQYAEPNYLISIDQSAVDPRFAEQWALHNTGQEGGVAGADIAIRAAWEFARGSGEIIVAVTDTGVDYNHPELAPNMWINPNPTVGDIHGARWTGRAGGMTSGDPMDVRGHGTHVAGTIGAIANNGIGVVGVSPEVRIMALKFLNGGLGATADAIAAIEYAIENGAHLINASWGGGGFSLALQEAIADAARANVLFVASAGNDQQNTDEVPNYPASYNLPNILSVASSTRSDTLSSFSNYGINTVHLAAPGSEILSTVVNAAYDLYSGTSMAAPHVTGVAALLLSIHPSADYWVIRDAILSGVTPLPEFEGRVASGGRLNATGAISALGDSLDYSLSALPDLPATLAPGQSLALQVLYHPILAGAHAATVFIESRDPESPLIAVALSGGVATQAETFADWAVRLDLPIEQRGPYDRHGPLQMTNLLAYAMGLDPRTASPEDMPRMTLSPDRQWILYHYRRGTSTTGIVVAFEGSENLVEWWETVPVQDWLVERVGGVQQRTARFALENVGRFFLRMKVTFADGSPGVETLAEWAIRLDLPIHEQGPYDRHGPLQIPNLLAFAMGVDPRSATTGDLPGMVPAETGDRVNFRYRRSTLAGGIGIRFEGSEDLVEWREATPVEDILIEELVGFHWRLASFSIVGKNRFFLRLNVHTLE
jgi:subtilisin family serine protease/outer membrane protein assembly factor BamB